MEDLGTYGDITTRTVIPAEARYTARLNAREAGVVSGMQIAALAFRLVDMDSGYAARSANDWAGNICAAGV
ncbi:Quinolinate phosphoribosyl transferase, N-terminal domain [Sulfitobacter brevis]|uniref:Quinolinate phosphoribosyl transferase, N-terminal domain n=1 Tax=Sulfitobacter brevis TaxID=74348 RepID=A0A1I2F8K6_9RHOB|nr:Quinolinate phosphoribosyl transferase, N-terminal domain [Sulfitobacter brevis]